MATASRPKALIGFPTPDALPDLGKAVALGLAVARHCKATTWAEFVERLENHDEEQTILLAGLALTEEQTALIRDHDHVLRLLSVRPLVTIALCPSCQGWVLTAGTPPTRCKVTLRCDGKPVKVGIAVKQVIAAEEPEDPATDTDSLAEPVDSEPGEATEQSSLLELLDELTAELDEHDRQSEPARTAADTAQFDFPVDPSDLSDDF